MYERFTDRARKVMQLANDEAQKFGHDYLGTEHILLGLAREGSGIAAIVLRHFGIDLRILRLEVEKKVQPGKVDILVKKLPLTPKASHVIECAHAEASQLNMNYVGTEHLLLGLLHDPDGVAAQVLSNLGLTFAQIRAHVCEVVGMSTLPPQPMELPFELRDEVTLLEEKLLHKQRLKEEAVAKMDFEIAAVLHAETEALKRDMQAALRGEQAPPEPSIELRDKFDQFTGQARKAMQRAYQEAQRWQHDYLGTGHLLAGVLREGGLELADLLRGRGLDRDQLLGEVERLLEASPEGQALAQLPLTPSCKKSLEWARAEARAQNGARVAPNHLLLGLLRLEDAEAVHLFHSLGVSIEALTAELRRLPPAADRDHMVRPELAPGSVAAIDPSSGKIAQLVTDEILPEPVRTTIVSQQPMTAAPTSVNRPLPMQYLAGAGIGVVFGGLIFMPQGAVLGLLAGLVLVKIGDLGIWGGAGFFAGFIACNKHFTAQVFPVPEAFAVVGAVAATVICVLLGHALRNPVLDEAPME
ncbi:MAG: hypothetical protein L0215_12405 [Gemmataceae bacterium]|nr:hypothetical protein [Gemmataceae bacterium]